ncbi:hypothetical protein P4O66_021161, partial [Electrophorus voltai]
PAVSVTKSRVSGEEGSSVSVQCLYSAAYKKEAKKWCRSIDWTCYTVGRTNTSQNSAVQISDDGKGTFTVLMTGLKKTDAGWYWCSTGGLEVPVHFDITDALAASNHHRNTNQRRMPGKGKKKGKKGKRRTSPNSACNPSVLLGTLLTPAAEERGLGAEVEESHGITSDHNDWYNYFQSSESDTADFSCTRMRPSLILSSLHGITTEQGPAGYYGDLPIYEDRYLEVESAESYMDLTEGYAEYGERGECRNVTLESDLGSDHEEDPSMEVEEVPQGNLGAREPASSPG